MSPMSSQRSSQAPSGRKRKRLQHPRTPRACTFCRRRKVRCSGTLPCEYCINEDVPQTCDYGQGFPPPNHGNSADTPQDNAAGGNTIEHPRPSCPKRPADSRTAEDQSHHTMYSRRNSFEPPQMFAEDQHIGPAAGISFLYHPWNKTRDRTSRAEGIAGTVSTSSSVPLNSYGDFPESVLPRPQSLFPTRLTPDQISITLERYFRFATPTYRYMHRPTLEKWGLLYVNDDPRLGNAQRACVLLASAQSLLYTVKSDCYVTEDCDGIRQSWICFQQAKELLDRETGAPSLASVQSRLAMCLYMLSTYRMTACRFCFSLTATILTSLGLHRVQSTKSQRIAMDTVEAESRRRAFWCAYVLDGYLSVMLGRPRILRDDDVDQPYPRNVDDEDLMSPEPVDDLPQHGNLEAFLAHASLAKLMAKSSDRLYPLHPLTEEQVLNSSNELLDELESWKQSLPKFLRPGSKILTGDRMFERQNTVLKLAHAHLRILMSRRCLLSDTCRLGHLVHTQSPPDLRTTRPIQECVAGITTVLDAGTALMEHDSLFHCFWFTQYIALVAASTLYIFLVQGARHALPASMDSFIDVELYFDKAKKCQSRLDALAPPGSQAKRHYQLLDHLKCRVERDLAAGRATATSVDPIAVDTRNIQHDINSQESTEHPSVSHGPTRPEIVAPSANMQQRPFSHGPQADLPHSTIPQWNLSDFPLSAPQITSGSDTDQSIVSMMDLGWASFDTIGFMNTDDTQFFSDHFQ